MCSLFLKQKYYEIGGRSAKYLAHKLRKQQEESAIYKIRNAKTKVLVTKMDKIHECFEAYYKELYSQPIASEESDIDSNCPHFRRHKMRTWLHLSQLRK